VAIRRFNQAVALNSQNRSKTGGLQSKEIMQRAGDVRNLDITIKLVAKLKGTKLLQAKLRRRREAAAKQLANPLKTWSPPDKLPAATPDKSRAAAVRAINLLFKRGAKAHRPKDLHRLRIAAKKLRYTLEMVAPGHPEMEEIKSLQTDLGRINDYRTARSIVKAEAGANSVRDQLKEKQRKKIRAFRDRWSSTLADPAVARAWIRKLS
jgi:CHAD domain-containing protein